MNIIKKFEALDKYTRFSVITVILFSVIVFTLASIYHISGDACWHISVSKFISEEKKMPLNEGLGRNEPFWAPPLFHIASAFVYSIPAGGILVKFISPIFAVLTLILAFLTARKLFDAKIAFYAIIFLAFIPIFLDYSIFSYVESMLTFFVVLSVYFAIKNKILLSSIATGLGILTKYNALFIIPVLIYIVYKNNKRKKTLLKNISIIALLPLIIASPWLIRNWILLGNPIWPFLNFVFHGLQDSSFTKFNLSNLTNINLIISTYLGMFGVPNGNLNTLFFFDIPFLTQLLVVWLIGTLIFIFPLAYIFYIKKIKNKALLSIWIILYMMLFLLYVPNVGFGVTRTILPAIPALAIIWAHGFNKILTFKYKKIILAIFILVMLGFVFTEFAKITLAARGWSFYNDDFQWVKSNTEKNAIFMAGGQCLSYNLNRQTLYPSKGNIAKADYIWVNQDFALDKRSILDKDLLKSIENKDFNAVYQNSKTNTMIYKVR